MSRLLKDTFVVTILSVLTVWFCHDILKPEDATMALTVMVLTLSAIAVKYRALLVVLVITILTIAMLLVKLVINIILLVPFLIGKAFAEGKKAGDKSNESK